MRAPRKRCAIYTRKSSEEGLEQDFNSLAAQRESCEAYIASQRGDGWIALPDRYDDGGFSGGTLERPAVQELLQAIDAGDVDIVVVYKVDRLTRSLTDFAKLIDRFDTYEVSVVAVTQPFNTTTSMGRLTLNVLLSFAQFEREITGERIRDKIAASKQKGMWMGGCVPIGYDLGERELIVNSEEATIVRSIFERYLVLGAVRKLQHALEQDGIRSKVRTSRNGNRSGGKRFSRGALYALLRNRLYVGDITHQGKSYPGQHAAIVDTDLFDAVQAKLDAQRQNSKLRGSEPSLLAGKLFDGQGQRLSPSHTNKRGKRYRYYVSQAVMRGGHSPTRARWPAKQLEAFVRSAVAERLKRPIRLLDEDAGDIAIDDRCAHLANAIANEGTGDRLMLEVLESAVLTDNACTLTLKATTLCRELGIPDDAGQKVTWEVRLDVRTCHNGQKRIQSPDAPAAPNRTLVSALVNAHQWYEAVMKGSATISHLARSATRDSRYIKRVLTLAYLAPDLKHAILEGTQPAGMTLEALTRREMLPIEFDVQRRCWGISP